MHSFIWPNNNNVGDNKIYYHQKYNTCSNVGNNKIYYQKKYKAGSIAGDNKIYYHGN